MNSDIRWLDNTNGFVGNSMMSRVCLSIDQIIGVFELATDPNLVSIFTGDYTKWCSSLIWYPINFPRYGKLKYMYLGNQGTDARCYTINYNNYYGFYMGSFKYVGKNNNFTDYEPYTTIQAYLPYYGYVDLPVVSVYNKYIHFILNIDFNTGQACYNIAVGNDSLTVPNNPFIVGTNFQPSSVQLDGFRIISQISFQLGVQLPLGTTGYSDMLRNLIMGTVKTAGVAIGGAVGYGLGAGIGNTVQRTSSTSSYSRTVRNPDTGRQILTSRLTKNEKDLSERKSDYSQSYLANSIGHTMTSAIDAISSCSSTPATSIVNNSNLIFNCPKSVHLIVKRLKYLSVDDDYAHLYGYPLGETKTLNDLRGYTEITAIHIEGEEFKNASSQELDELNTLLKSGIIL